MRNLNFDRNRHARKTKIPFKLEQNRKDPVNRIAISVEGHFLQTNEQKVFFKRLAFFITLNGPNCVYQV